jgi:hypothetical protein
MAIILNGSELKIIQVAARNFSIYKHSITQKLRLAGTGTGLPDPKPLSRILCADPTLGLKIAVLWIRIGFHPGPDLGS